MSVIKQCPSCGLLFGEDKARCPICGGALEIQGQQGAPESSAAATSTVNEAKAKTGPAPRAETPKPSAAANTQSAMRFAPPPVPTPQELAELAAAVSNTSHRNIGNEPYSMKRELIGDIVIVAVTAVAYLFTAFYLFYQFDFNEYMENLFLYCPTIPTVGLVVLYMRNLTMIRNRYADILRKNNDELDHMTQIDMRIMIPAALFNTFFVYIANDFWIIPWLALAAVVVAIIIRQCKLRKKLAGLKNSEH